MQKLNRALLQYLRMNFTYHVQSFSEMLPEGQEQIYYLPTKNMLDYILVRLQGVAKLMCRAADCAKTAAKCMEQRMALGHFWKIAFICFAVASRVWALVVEIIKFCCKFFDVAVEYSSLLKNTTPQWLSNDYAFPRRLKEWLNIGWPDENFTDNNDSGTIPELNLELEATEEKDEETSTIKLRGFESSDIFETVGKLKTPENTLNNPKRKRKHRKLKKEFAVNLSESEDLYHKKHDLNKPEKKKKANNADIIDSLNTIQELKKFLQNEDHARELSGNQCRLHNLDKLQWNMTKKKVKLLLVKAARSKDSAVSLKKFNEARGIIKQCVNEL